jgi:hypothetical protein
MSVDSILYIVHQISSQGSSVNDEGSACKMSDLLEAQDIAIDQMSFLRFRQR